MKYLIGAMIVCLTGLISCKPEPEDMTRVTVEDLTGLDGCGLVLKLSNGQRLEPINLNEFNVTLNDGDVIWVNYVSAPDYASICMVGEMIEIIDIQ